MNIDKIIPYIVNNKIKFSSIEKLISQRICDKSIYELLEENKIDIDYDELESCDDTNSLKKYLSDIGKIKMLTDEEFNRLIVEAQKGDVDSRNRIIEANLRFVVSIAKNYYGDLLEIIQEGNIGLIEAIEKFDISCGTKFTSYAGWYIEKNIKGYFLNKKRQIRLPTDKSILLKKYKELKEIYENKNNNFLDVKTAARLLETSEENIFLILRADSVVNYLDQKIGEEGSEATFIDYLEDDNINIEKNIEDREIKKILIDEISKLTPRQKSVLTERYVRQRSLQSIGDEYNISRERVNQIERKALHRLRRNPLIKSVKK